jgi:type IV secretion system protein VirB10
MPWNENGQAPAVAGNGTAVALSYGQLPSPEQYLAQVQQRSALAGQNPGTAYGGGIPTSYTSQNMQSEKERFAGTGAGAAGVYQWNSEYTLWKGTVIPAVLETGINSDLPGAVIARVTKNVYSSLDGRYLLIPEGSRLYAMYNSNISYNQSRVQIAWNTLIRPDGLEIALGNMQGIDLQGYTGQKGTVNEHFFEYLKAMGIISAFTVANGELDNQMQSMGTSSYTDQVVSENRNVINQLAGKLIDRALDIQPTITVKQGTEINVLTNVTIEIPPLEPYPAVKKYQR